MADEGLKITVKFRHNAITGKKDIDVSYEEDESTPSWKHDQKHKQIVEKLLGKGILTPDEIGDVKVTRLVPKRREETQEPGQKAPVQRLTEKH